MAGNRRRDVALPDPGVPAGFCDSELTQMMNFDPRQGKCTKWTDEKHSSYLNFLEATFVEELHHTVCINNSRSQKKRVGPQSTRYLPTNMSNRSDQFEVLQDGFWHRLKFDRSEQLVDSTADNPVCLESPWVRHFVSAGKHQSTECDTVENSGSCRGSVHFGSNLLLSSGSGSSGQYPGFHLCHQDTIATNEEFSDQNFVEDGYMLKSKHAPMAKRLKKAVVDSASNDQVVPSGNFRKTDVSTSNDASFKGEGSQNGKLLSELPETFICENLDLQHYFKGS